MLTVKARLAGLALLCCVLGAPVARSAEKLEPDADELDRYSKVSMVFAGQDVRSVSAQFGHTYLVFHNQALPEFNAITFEFTVDLPNTWAYLQTLTASVDGRYKIKYLANKQRDTDLVARNSWVYTLDLNAAERAKLRQLITARLSQHPGYSIFSQNCASQVIEPVALAKGLVYHNPHPFFETPEQTLRWLNDQHLITASYFLPSLQRRHAEEAAQLAHASAADRALSVKLASAESQATQLSEGSGVPPSGTTLADPARFSTGQQVALGLVSAGRTYLSYRPGFVGADNEALYGFHDVDSTFFALRVRHDTQNTRLDNLTLVNMESYVPAGSEQVPYTQRLALYYQDDATLLPGHPRYWAAEYARGWTAGSQDVHVSLLPMASLRGVWAQGKSTVEPRLAVRAHAFVDQGLAGFRVTADYDRYLSPVLAEKSKLALRAQHVVTRQVGFALNLVHLTQTGGAGTEAGLSLYADF